VLFVVSAAAAVAFVAIERRSPDPVLRLEFFRGATFSSATAVALATSFGLFAVFFFTALYLQVVDSYTGWKIALEFVSMSAAMVVAGIAAGRWTATRGPREPMAVGCLLAAGSMVGVEQVLDPNVSFALLAAALAGVGVGLGLGLVAVTAAVLAIVPAERSGMAASTVNTSRQFGGVLAVAILGAVVNGQLVSELGRKLTALNVPEAFRSLVIDAVTRGGLPANTAAAAAANPIAAANLGKIGQVIDAAKQAFGHGLHVALAVTAVILLVAGVVALLAGGRRRELV
jgi:MFS family permease